MPTILDWLEEKARPFLTAPIDAPRRRPGGPFIPMSKAEERRIRRLYVRERLSSYVIADMIGRHNTGVRKALRRMGVKIRSLSQAARVRPGSRAPVPTTYVSRRRRANAVKRPTRSLRSGSLSRV